MTGFMRGKNFKKVLTWRKRHDIIKLTKAETPKLKDKKGDVINESQKFRV